MYNKRIRMTKKEHDLMVWALNCVDDTFLIPYHDFRREVFHAVMENNGNHKDTGNAVWKIIHKFKPSLMAGQEWIDGILGKELVKKVYNETIKG